MKRLNEYIIPFKGLNDGEHDFNYVLNNSFLKRFENTDIKDINIDVKVKMLKNNRLLEFSFDLKGNAIVECDRCLDEFSLPIDYQTIVIVKSENVEDANDDIIYLPLSESEIDISQTIYENIVFSIPQKRVHPYKNGKSLCNKEMLKKLNKYLIENSSENPDPRWNELNKMFNN